MRPFVMHVRVYRHHIAFSVASTLSIAIGMALVTTVLSVVASMLFGPLPFRDADRLVNIYVPSSEASVGHLPLLTSIRRNVLGAEVAAYRHSMTLIGGTGDARRLVAAQVSTAFFDVAGTYPLLGKGFDVAADVVDDGSVVISHSVWSTQFGGDRYVIGKRLVVGGEPRTVVGVMPRGFDFPSHAAVWLPLPTRAPRIAALHDAPYSLLVRTDGRRSIASLRSQIDLLYRRTLTASAPSGEAPEVVSLRDHLTESLRAQLRLWAALATLVLILCGVNFATMSFARGMARNHEIAIRRALGAPFIRVVGELLAESAVISVVGSAVALVLAYWLTRLASVWLTDASSLAPATIDWRTAGVSILITLTVGLSFAILPAIDASRTDIRALVQSGASGSSDRHGHLRSRKALVGLQLALAMGATAVVASFVKADRTYQRGESRIDYSKLITATLLTEDTVTQPVPVRTLVEQIDAVPGIASTAAFNGCADTFGAPADVPSRRASGVACSVSPGYFEALNVLPIAGRLPTEDEARDQAEIVVLSRRFADRTFGSSSAALGQSVHIFRHGWDSHSLRVIGVVDDIGDAVFGFNPEIFRARDLAIRQSAVLIIRARRRPPDAIKELTRAVRRFDLPITVSDIAAANDVVDRGRLKARGRELFLGFMATLAIVLAIVGVFGLTAYSTALRAREFGIRLALGAGPRHLLWLTAGDLRWSAATGFVVGVAASMKLTTWLDAMFRPGYMTNALFSVPASAVVATGAALVVIVGVGVGVPLYRTMRMDLARSIASVNAG